MAILALIFISSYSQQPEDPFHWTKPIVIPSSIYVLWSGGMNPDSLNPFLNVYFSSTDSHTVENLRADSLNLPVGGNKKMDLSVVDLDHNGTNELIGAWEGADSSVVLTIMDPNYHLNVPVEGKLIQGSGEQRRIYTVPGDFDGDGYDEFVLAFMDQNKYINIRLFDSDGTFEPKLKASVSNESLSGNPMNESRFCVIAGDFNQDGKDEIALISYDADNDPEYERGVYVRIYDYVNGSLVPKAKTVIIPETTITNSQFSLNEIGLAATTIPGNGGQPDMIALAFTTLHNEGPNVDDTYLQMVKSSGDLNSLVSDQGKLVSKHYNDNFLPSISLVSGDLDADGSSELVFSRSGTFDIYSTTASLDLAKVTSGGFTTSNNGDDLHDSYDYMEMCNLDDLPGEELIVVKNIYSNDWENPFPQGFNLSVYGDTTGTLSGFALKSSAVNKTNIPYSWPNRTYALAVGDFQNSKVTIQAPRYSHRTGVSQPIVVLNAPPVHFDVFDGTIYDINTCYSNQDCKFTSTYFISTTQTSELKTDIQSSWAVSAGLAREGSVGVGLQAEAAPLGVGGSVSATYSDNFEYHLLANYGEHFEKTSTVSKSQTVQLEVSAIEDDQIFSTVTDYDIWEYPYFIGNSTEESGVIVTFVPTKSEARWFPSKSVSGYSYQPIHEVGNILSYYSYDSIHKNPKVFQEIQPENDISTPTFTLSSNSDYHWELKESNFIQNDAYQGIQFGVDAGSMALGFKKSFNQSDAYLYTSTTTVSDEIRLRVDIGGIDRSIGPTEYRITPYAYWSNQGALVIDYSVEPEIDLQGGQTWWQEMYGSKSDPTMILPWLLDPEKGFAVSDESKRQQTTDILLKPSYLSPGDTAIVTANVRNFSLVNTPSSVKVQFYLGDPKAGGELVSDIYGNTEFLTDGPVASRSVKTISFVWVKPKDLSQSRLYMVIDPDNTIDEVHENNNTGWISLQDSQTDAVIDYPAQNSGGLELYQNYPNPFDESSRIDYSLSRSDNITINIYDISGKLLRSYVPGLQGAGRHSLEIDGTGLKTGVYYYTLRGTSTGTRSRKMMIIH